MKRVYSLLVLVVASMVIMSFMALSFKHSSGEVKKDQLEEVVAEKMTHHVDKTNESKVLIVHDRGARFSYGSSDSRNSNAPVVPKNPYLAK